MSEPDAALLARIAEALERLAPPPPPAPDFERGGVHMASGGGGFCAGRRRLTASNSIFSRASTARAIFCSPTRGASRRACRRTTRFCGARAAWANRRWSRPSHGALAGAGRLKLVEIHREDIESLPALLAALRDAPFRFIVFCDDLAFDGPETSYKSLKTALEGGVAGRPGNVLFYATSNRRHLTAAR